MNVDSGGVRHDGGYDYASLVSSIQIASLRTLAHKGFCEAADAILLDSKKGGSN
jgi:hypothetical protein